MVNATVSVDGMDRTDCFQRTKYQNESAKMSELSHWSPNTCSGHINVNNKTEFMFVGINTFLTRLRVVLAWATLRLKRTSTIMPEFHVSRVELVANLPSPPLPAKSQVYFRLEVRKPKEAIAFTNQERLWNARTRLFSSLQSLSQWQFQKLFFSESLESSAPCFHGKEYSKNRMICAWAK